jgi:chromosome segregation ATPase
VLPSLKGITRLNNRILSQKEFASLAEYYDRLHILQEEGQGYITVLLRRATGRVETKLKQVRIWRDSSGSLIDDISTFATNTFDSYQADIRKIQNRLMDVAPFSGEPAIRRAQELTATYQNSRAEIRMPSTNVTRLEKLVINSNLLIGELPIFLDLWTQLKAIETLVEQPAKNLYSSREEAVEAFQQLAKQHKGKWSQLVTDRARIKNTLDQHDREVNSLRQTAWDVQGFVWEARQLADNYRKVAQWAWAERKRLIENKKALNQGLREVEERIGETQKVLDLHSRFGTPFAKSLEMYLGEARRNYNTLTKDQLRDSYVNIQKKLEHLISEISTLLSEHSPVLRADSIQSIRNDLLEFDDSEIIDDICKGELAKICNKFGRGQRKDEKIDTILCGCLSEPKAAKELLPRIHATR